MSCTWLSPQALPWTQGAHPLERKKASDERPMLLIELGPGFVDPSTCRRSHVIYVLSGELVLQLGAGERRVGQGEACWIDAGTEHRACNQGSVPVVAFIASDISSEIGSDVSSDLETPR